MIEIAIEVPHRQFLSTWKHYYSEDTMQIVQEGHSKSSLAVHEQQPGDATLPLCNTLILPWHGETMIGYPQGPGIVTCGRCINMHQAAAA